MQSKLWSFAEAATNVVSGFVVGIGTQLIIFPWFGISTLTLHQNILMTLIFSATSLVRGYGLRRLFNFIESLRKHRAKKNSPI